MSHQQQSNVAGTLRDRLARLAPSATDPTGLVERSIAFLLQREPPTSILRTFDLTAIGHFFPSYEATIRARR